MDIMEAIRQRRSIREYSEKIPDDRDVERILDAGRWAPSGLNNQPWKFLVVRDNDLKNDLAKFTKYGKIITDAPVVICIFLDNSSTYNRDKDLMSTGACIQNMALAALSLGLGTCWLGEILNQKEAVHRLLNINEDLELTAVLSLGYPDEDIGKGHRESLKNFLIKLNK